MGIMRIMPRTWAELCARYGLGAAHYGLLDNILAGSAYIRELHNRYGLPGFLAAYNAGPRRYWRRGARYRRDAGVCRDARADDREHTHWREDCRRREVVHLGSLTAIRCAHREQLNGRSAAARRTSRSSTKRPCSCQSIGAGAAVRQHVCASGRRHSIAMIQIALHRSLSRVIACSDLKRREQGDTSHRWQDKAGFPAAGTSFLSVCLQIVLGRCPTFRRNERAALFPIIILFQRSESRRPRRTANRRSPYLRRRRYFHAASRGPHSGLAR
jgi:hypothetical protein